MNGKGFCIVATFMLAAGGCAVSGPALQPLEAQSNRIAGLHPYPPNPTEKERRLELTEVRKSLKRLSLSDCEATWAAPFVLEYDRLRSNWALVQKENNLSDEDMARGVQKASAQYQGQILANMIACQRNLKPESLFAEPPPPPQQAEGPQ